MSGTVLILGAVAVFVAIAKRQWPQAGPSEFWAELALRLHGQVSRGADGEELVIGELEGVRIVVDRVVDRWSRPRKVWTRIALVSPELRDVALRIVTRTLAGSMLAAAARRRQVAVGRRDFDEEWRIIADAPAQARSWLDGQVCDRLVDCQEWQIDISNGRARMQRVGCADDTGMIWAAACALVSLVTAEARFQSRWRDFARRLGAAEIKPFGFETHAHGKRVSIEVDRSQVRPLVRVRAELGCAEEELRGRLAAEPTPLLVRTEGTSLLVELETGAEPDADAIEQALILVARLARPAAPSPYR